MGVGEFARDAARQLAAPEWRRPALLLFLLLAVTQVILALSKPDPGQPPGAAFAVAGLVRGLGLIWVSVAMFRAALESPRRRWLPDGGFWLYFLLSLLALAASAAAALLATGLPGDSRIVVVQLVAVLLIAPLTVWMVAAAVERPLALAPRFSGISSWLPPLLLLAILVVVPLASLHAHFSLRLIEAAGQGLVFWGMALVDGVLSTFVALLTLALRVAVYRSVARG